MGKHHRRSKFARNAAAATATFAGVSAMVVPAAGANPLGAAQQYIDQAQNIAGQFGVGTPEVPFVQEAFEIINGGEVAAAPAPVQSTGARIVAAARSQIGTPYQWGGNQPGGFDCSGLTSWAYSQVGKSIPRTSQAQANSGMAVGYNAKQLGDIISFYSGATHVGIYSGGENVIHAPQSGQTVTEAPISYMPVNNVVRF